MTSCAVSFVILGLVAAFLELIALAGAIIGVAKLIFFIGFIGISMLVLGYAVFKKTVRGGEDGLRPEAGLGLHVRNAANPEGRHGDWI